MVTCRMHVAVHPRSRREGVEIRADGTLRVSVHAPPEPGQANDAVRSLLAEALGVGATEVRIVTGLRGGRKVVELPLAAEVARALLRAGR